MELNPATGLESGQNVTVQWNDANTGNGAATGSWTDTLVVTNTTTGQTLDTKSVPYNATASGNGPLAAGQSNTQKATILLPDGTPGIGSIQFTVTVDSANNIFEYNSAGTAETNNTASTSETATAAPYPDLQVAGLQLTPSTGLESGQNVTVQWNDANTGNGAATGSWTDTLVVTNTTTGQTLDTKSVPYNATASGNGPLAAGQSNTQKATILLPDGTSGIGSIQFTVTVDSANNIFEFNSAGTAETNNTANTSETATAAAYPDLQVAGLQLNPATGLQSGQNVTVQWNDANTGNGAASGSWTDTLVVKDTTTGQTLDTKSVPYNATTSGNGPLAAGQSNTQQSTILLPDGTPGIGSIQFTVTVDSANNIFEFNSAGTAETNNTASTSETTTAAPYPDLQVTGLELNPATGLESGQNVTVQWNDANTGNGAATGSWTDTLVVTNTTTGQTLDTKSVPYNATASGNGPLAAGQSNTQKVTILLPDGTPGIGSIQFTVTVDSANTIFEYNSAGTAETNNTASTSESTTAAPYADLQVTGLTATPATGLQTGNTVTLNWNDSNTGNAGTGSATWVDAVVVTNLTTGATLLSTTVPGASSINAGQSQALNDTLRLPAGNASVGQLQFTVTVDANNSVFEYNSAGTGETNNSTSITQSVALGPYPDLQVTNVGITPLTGILSGSTVQVAWNDTNTGNAPTTGPWSDRLIVVNTATGQTVSTATLYYDAVASGPLAAGASVARQFPVKLPDGAPGIGQLQATILTDVFNNIAEFNAAGTGETNNSASAIFTSTSALYPDLQPTNLQISPATDLQSGDNLTVQWNDSNSGTGSAATAWSDTVTVQNTTTGATVGTATVGYDPTATGNRPLASGQSLAESAQITLPPGNAGVGNLLVTVTVNATNSLFEDNAAHNAQSNNTASITTPSGLAPYPDLAASGVTFSPASPIVGDPAQVTVGWTVTNLGTGPTSTGSWVDDVVYSSDNNPADGHLLASFTHTGDLAVNASYTQSQTFLLPPAFEGQYHLFVETNATNAVFENGSTANNDAQASSLFDVTPTLYADLIVSSVTAPATAASGQSLTVAWSVANQGIGITNPGSWDDSVSLATDPQGTHIVAGLGTFAHTARALPWRQLLNFGRRDPAQRHQRHVLRRRQYQWAI